MAKRRPPSSRHAALDRACGLLTYEAAAEITGKSESWLRRCADHAEDREISLADALKLDRALIEIGEEPTLFRWYASQVETGGPPSVENHLNAALYELQQAAVRIEARQISGPELISAGKSTAEISLQAAKLAMLIFDRGRDEDRDAAERLKLVPRGRYD